LTDAAYAKLLHKLDGHYADMPQDLRTNLLAFYRDLKLPIATKTNEGEWATLLAELEHLGAINRDLAAASTEVADAAVAK